MSKIDDGQWDLFPKDDDADNGEAYARGSDPDTSHDAAKEIRGVRASKLEAVAYKAFWGSKGRGLTNHELVEETDLPWNTITPRVRPLVRKGLVRDTGNRRKGPPGKYCIVWDVT